MAINEGLYGDMMMEFNWSIGQLLQVLWDNEIEDNTLIIFTSDNRPWLNYGNHAGSAGGIREGKQTTWEGGNRIPAIIRWPQVVAAGLVNNYMAATIDVLPTVAAITGATLPGHKIDGVNISSLLKGEKTVNLEKVCIFIIMKTIYRL